jgi:hypothetical protein
MPIHFQSNLPVIFASLATLLDAAIFSAAATAPELDTDAHRALVAM